jgi:antirestriction protein ArdC
MTNAMIIFNESQRLAEEGILNYTGREVTYVDEKGEEQIYKEVEPIHTYAMWKELGYQVQKGEKAKAQIIIWKFVSSKKEESDEEPNSKMFMKKASFFTQAQVKAIEGEQ